MYDALGRTRAPLSTRYLPQCWKDVRIYIESLFFILLPGSIMHIYFHPWMEIDFHRWIDIFFSYVFFLRYFYGFEGKMKGGTSEKKEKFSHLPWQWMWRISEVLKITGENFTHINDVLGNCRLLQSPFTDESAIHLYSLASDKWLQFICRILNCHPLSFTFQFRLWFWLFSSFFFHFTRQERRKFSSRLVS